jgi:hypothetical protein
MGESCQEAVCIAREDGCACRCTKRRSQLTRSLWGPTADLGRLKRCRPSWPARDVCLWIKLSDTQDERRGEHQETRSLNYWGKTGVVFYASRPTKTSQCLLAVATVSRGVDRHYRIRYARLAQGRPCPSLVVHQCHRSNGLVGTGLVVRVNQVDIVSSDRTVGNDDVLDAHYAQLGAIELLPDSIRFDLISKITVEYHGG